MKRILAVIMTLAMLLVCFAGCAAKSEASVPESWASDSAMGVTEEAPMAEEWIEEEVAVEESKSESSEGGFDLLQSSEAQVTERKIIYTANYLIYTEQFDADYNKILAAAESVGGYLSSENTNGTRPEEYGDPGRNAYFSLRIPIENYKSFLDTVSGIGTVESKRQSSEDVTTAYYDNEARIEFYEAHYNKLMGYLEKAATIEDMMSIEAQITETLYTLDSLKGTRSYYDNLTQFTTVDIELYEVVHSSEIPTSKKTLGDRISGSFSDVLSALGVFFEGVIVVIVGGAPIWIILVIVGLAIYLPIRAHRKKKRLLAQAEETKTEEQAE